EGSNNQEDEEGGGNTASDGPTPTPLETLTAPTGKDQSSSDPPRSITSNPSDTGDVSDSQTHASGQESLGGGPAAGTTSPLPNSSQQAAGGVHAVGGRTSQGSQASGQTVTGVRDGKGNTARRWRRRTPSATRSRPHHKRWR
ncbi:mucin TcMUC, partial [Trypanosoma cruzi]